MVRDPPSPRLTLTLTLPSEVLEIYSKTKAQAQPRVLTYDSRLCEQSKQRCPSLRRLTVDRARWVVTEAGCDSKVYLTTLEGWSLGTTNNPEGHYVERWGGRPEFDPCPRPNPKRNAKPPWDCFQTYLKYIGL